MTASLADRYALVGEAEPTQEPHQKGLPPKVAQPAAKSVTEALEAAKPIVTPAVMKPVTPPVAPKPAPKILDRQSAEPGSTPAALATLKAQRIGQS